MAERFGSLDELFDMFFGKPVRPADDAVDANGRVTCYDCRNKVKKEDAKKLKHVKGFHTCYFCIVCFLRWQVKFQK